MQTVKLKGPAVIDGIVRHPAEGPIDVRDDVAERLLEQGILDDEASFENDDLASLKVADLKQLAEDEGVDLGDATKKDDIIAAITAHRAAAAE
jgi:hypothetical protein